MAEPQFDHALAAASAILALLGCNDAVALARATYIVLDAILAAESTGEPA